MPAAKNERLVLGLTGGLGTGKSTVLAMFRRRGAFVQDADAIVHALLKRDAAVRRRVRAAFGTLERAQLAAAVFSSPTARRRLEGILHPRVRQVMLSAVRRSRVFLNICDVPLLYEKGWQPGFDGVIVVTAPLAERLKRLKRRGMTAPDARARMAAQWPLARKVRLADFVIDNGGGLAATRRQVDSFVDAIFAARGGAARSRRPTHKPAK